MGVRKTFSPILLNLRIALVALAGYEPFYNPEVGRKGLFAALCLPFLLRIGYLSSRLPCTTVGWKASFRAFSRRDGNQEAEAAKGRSAAIGVDRLGPGPRMSQICVTTKSIFSVVMASDFSQRPGVDPMTAPASAALLQVL